MIKTYKKSVWVTTEKIPLKDLSLLEFMAYEKAYLEEHQLYQAVIFISSFGKKVGISFICKN